MKIKLSIIAGILLMIFALGFVVAQDSVVYYPTNYEYPDPNTMTNDIKLSNYYYMIHSLRPLAAEGWWGFRYKDEDGNNLKLGVIYMEVDAYQSTGYPDYLETPNEKAAYYNSRVEYWESQGYRAKADIPESSDEMSIEDVMRREKLTAPEEGATPVRDTNLLDNETVTITDDKKLESPEDYMEAEKSTIPLYFTISKAEVYEQVSGSERYDLEPTYIQVIEESDNYAGGYFKTTTTIDNESYTFVGKFTRGFTMIESAAFYPTEAYEAQEGYPGNYIFNKENKTLRGSDSYKEVPNYGVLVTNWGAEKIRELSGEVVVLRPTGNNTFEDPAEEFGGIPERTADNTEEVEGDEERDEVTAPDEGTDEERDEVTAPEDLPTPLDASGNWATSLKIAPAAVAGTVTDALVEEVDSKYMLKNFVMDYAGVQITLPETEIVEGDNGKWTFSATVSEIGTPVATLLKPDAPAEAEGQDIVVAGTFNADFTQITGRITLGDTDTTWTGNKQ